MEAQATNQNQPQQGQQSQQQSSSSITQPLEPKKTGKLLTKIVPFLLIIVVIGAGIFTGLMLTSVNKSKASQGNVLSEENLAPEIKENFSQTFKDEAEGIVEKNDDFEKYAQGPWKLIRTGGESQTAYLTSSVMDLDEFVGKKVKVYGETFGSDQVSWLMDVGKVEVIE